MLWQCLHQAQPFNQRWASHRPVWSSISSCPSYRSSHISQHDRETPWDVPAKDHSFPGRLNIQRMSSGKHTFTAGHQLKQELWDLYTALQERQYEWFFINWDTGPGGSMLMLVTQSSPHWCWMAFVAYLGLDRPTGMTGSHTPMERWSALSLGKQPQSGWRVEFVTL